jgi:hypothetical protein
LSAGDVSEKICVVDRQRTALEGAPSNSGSGRPFRVRSGHEIIAGVIATVESPTDIVYSAFESIE